MQMAEIWEVFKADTELHIFLVVTAILWAFVIGMKVSEKIWR